MYRSLITDPAHLYVTLVDAEKLNKKFISDYTMEDAEKTCLNCFQELIKRNWTVVKSVSVFLIGIYVAKKVEKIAANITIHH